MRHFLLPISCFQKSRHFWDIFEIFFQILPKISVFKVDLPKFWAMIKLQFWFWKMTLNGPKINFSLTILIFLHAKQNEEQEQRT
jgi:hypothetical protein